MRQLAEALDAPSLQEMTLTDIAIQGHEDLPERFRSAATAITEQARRIMDLELMRSAWGEALVSRDEQACEAEATVTEQAKRIAELERDTARAALDLLRKLDAYLDFSEPGGEDKPWIFEDWTAFNEVMAEVTEYLRSESVAALHLPALPKDTDHA